MERFSRNLVLYIFRKAVEEIRFIIVLQERRVLFIKPNIQFWSYLAQFFLEWEMFQTKGVEKFETHILCSITPPPENLAVYEIMWKNMLVTDRPQMAIWYGACASHAGCLIQGYRHPLRVFNTCAFSTETVVTLKRPQCYVVSVCCWILFGRNLAAVEGGPLLATCSCRYVLSSRCNSMGIVSRLRAGQWRNHG